MCPVGGLNIFVLAIFEYISVCCSLFILLLLYGSLRHILFILLLFLLLLSGNAMYHLLFIFGYVVSISKSVSSEYSSSSSNKSFEYLLYDHQYKVDHRNPMQL
eukprot:956783_1